MATDLEEILFRMRLDAGDTYRGTQAMLDYQKKASLEYVSFWEGALEKQAAAEIKANDASLARLEANLEAKAAATKVFFEEQAAQYDIAQGSVGAGMLAGGAKKAEGTAARDLEAGAAGAAGGGGIMIGSLAMRGGITAVRGALIGSWNYMIRGLVSAVLGIGVAAVSVLVGTAAVLGISEALGGPGVFKTLKAYKEKKANAASEKEMQKNAADILRSEIAALKEHQVISPEEAQLYESLLKNLNQESLVRVFNGINKLIPKGGRDVLLGKGFKTQKEQDAEAIKSADELADKYQKQLDKKKDAVMLEQDIADKTEAIAFLRKNVNALDKDSVEYHEARARLLGDEVALAADLAQQAKDLKEAGFMAAGSPELAAAQARVGRDYMKNQIPAGEEEAKYPTMEDLAGRDYTDRLNKLYGRGGRFDLGSGNGPMGDVARDYELAGKYQMWDREHGNLGQAEKDRQRAIDDIKKIPPGMVSPQQALEKIGDDTGKLTALWTALIKNGAIPIDVPEHPQ